MLTYSCSCLQLCSEKLNSISKYSNIRNSNFKVKSSIQYLAGIYLFVYCVVKPFNFLTTEDCKRQIPSHTISKRTRGAFKDSHSNSMTLQYRRRRKPSEKSKDDKLVTLNVSGKKFVTWESTLKKHPKTLLGSEMLSIFFDARACEYFLDRDPHMFRYILNFYRLGKLHASSEDCTDSFKDELDFFQICPTELQPCCWEDNTKVSIRQRRKTSTCSVSISTNSTRNFLWVVLEKGEASSLGRVIQIFIALVICLSVFLTILETVHYRDGLKFHERFRTEFQTAESFCTGVFTLEYILRLYAAPYRLKFLISKLSIIDLLAFLPFYVDLLVIHFAHTDNVRSIRNLLGVFRVLRIVRIVKLSRNFRHMRVMGQMLKVAFVDLGFLFFGFFLANLMFSTIMFYLEHNEGKSVFTSIPKTMWYTVVTMMTVG